MSLYEKILKAAKAEGYGEDEVKGAITDGVSELFVRTKKSGVDDEVVKQKLDTFGLPPELYTAPERAGKSGIETLEKVGGVAKEAIKTAASPMSKGMEALGEVLKPAGEALDDAVMGEPDHPLMAQMKSLGVKVGTQMAKEQLDAAYGPTAGRFLGDFASGGVGTAASLSGAARWFGADEMGKAFEKRAKEVQSELVPVDPNFADKVAEGFGSMAVFYIPGIGIQAGAARMAMTSARMASWFGVGASATLEALAEAGSVYSESLEREPENKELANQRASAVFWGNLPTLLITDKLGIFGETGGAVRKAVASSLMEGGQEGSQSIISNIALNDPAMRGVLESFGVGAIVGGGMGVARGVLEKAVPEARGTATEVAEAQKISDSGKISVEGEPGIQEFTPASPEVIEETAPAVESVPETGEADRIAADYAKSLGQEVSSFHKKFAKAVVERDENFLTPYVVAAKDWNVQSQKIWQKETGINLPTTKAGKKAALSEWAKTKAVEKEETPADIMPAAEVEQEIPATESVEKIAPKVEEKPGLRLKAKYGSEDYIGGDVVKGSTKEEFKKDSIKFLKSVGKELGLEGKPSFNPGGVAGSGDATATFLGPDGRGVYISIGDTPVPVAGKQHSQSISIMYRMADKENQYGVQSRNIWVPWDSSATEIAQNIKAELASAPEAKTEEPPVPADGPLEKPPKKPKKTKADEAMERIAKEDAEAAEGGPDAPVEPMEPPTDEAEEGSMPAGIVVSRMGTNDDPEKGGFKANYNFREVRNPNANAQGTAFNEFLTEEDARQAAEQYQADFDIAKPWWDSLRGKYDNKSQEAALLSAIASYSDADMRWSRIARNGATDEQIKSQLGFELGSQGGGSGPDMATYSYKGGENPQVWHGTSAARGKPTFSGKALVNKVRELLSIPQPSGEVKEDATRARGSSKKALKVKKARGKIAVEGESGHGEQFEVQDDVGEVAIRPEAGRAEVDPDVPGSGEEVGEGERAGGPGASGPSIPADAIPGDTRLSVEKPIELSVGQRKDLNARALAILEKPTDEITDADREVLRQYTGVGGLQAEEEGVLNQHYTSYQVIKFMWDKLAAMGVNFKGAQALEAAEGVGNFLGFKPDGIEFEAVELDERASKIASILYPSVKHHNIPFEKFVPSHGYDISIGNDPFGNFRGQEKYAEEAVAYSEIGAIHDFFIMKRIDLLKPNGVLALILSTGTMDKSDTKIRAKINAKAEFLGAYRLPQGTFKKNAGFEGSVDLMFFRKRVSEELGKKDLLQPEFIETTSLELEGSGEYKSTVNMSSYFIANPRKVLGRLVAGGRYQNRAEVKLPKNQTIQEHLERVLNDEVKLVPKATKASKVQGGYIEDQANIGDAEPGAMTGSYVLKGGKLAVVGKSGKLFDAGKPRNLPRVKAAIELMSLADRMMAAVREKGQPDRTAQKALLKKVQAYFKDHKASPGFDRLLKSINEDPRFPRLAGLMSEDGTPADILTKDNIFPEAKKVKPAKKGDLKDSIRFAKDSGKESDIAIISQSFGKTEEETKEALLGAGWNREGDSVVPDSEYLVGDLWPKIDKAVEAGLDSQVAKLKAALPEQKTIQNVPASIVYPWMPARARDGFLAHAGIGGKLVRAVDPISGRLEWTIQDGGPGTMEELSVNYNSPAEAITKYINHQKEYKVDPSDRSRRILDREATEKLKVVDQEFEKYIRSDAANKEEIVDAYNRAFRSYTRSAPDSEPAALPGISSTFKGRPLVVKSHQWEWVRMATERRASINAHGVGGGKTMAAILAGQMASVKNGAKRKLYVVPAKIIKKWAYEIQQIFPSAKVISLEELSSTNAHKMLQQVAMNEFDFALISQDRLKMIPMKSSEKFLEEDLNNIRERLLTLKSSGKKKNLRTERDLQERLVKFEEKLRGIQEMKKTNTIWWEDLNIDLLAVDEAHNYKRVDVDYGVYASESHISGGNQSSDRGNDLNYKTREMSSRGKGNILFLTATPTTNRPIEIYSMIRYLAPQEWTSRGIMNGQDFVDSFATIEQRSVPDLDGVMVEKTLITGYKNLHDLRAIASKYVDFRPTADLKEVDRPDADYSIIQVPSSKDQQKILAKIVADLEYVTKDPRAAMAQGINKMSLTTAGRQAAVGADIYDAASYPSWEEPDSKIAYAVDNIMKLEKEMGAGQLVFLDMFRGYAKTQRLSKDDIALAEASGEKVKKFKPDVLVNYHEKIRAKLIKRGFKANQIAIINGEVNNTPALKQRVADEYNAGRLKIVIGTTTSMGEGMDLQADTVAIHNMDLPWTPAGLEQRNGRGLRQGNKNDVVKLFIYQTKGSLDAFMSGKLAVKDNWNTNLWLGKEDLMSNSLNNDEVEGIDYEDMSKNLTVDKATLDHWRQVRERDIETALQAERAEQISSLERRIDSRNDDIKHSKSMIDTYRVRLAEDQSGYGQELNSGRIATHEETIKTTSIEIETLQKELETLKAAQEAGKAKLVVQEEPGATPTDLPAKSLGSAAATDFEGQEPPAEELHPTETEDPEGIDRAIGGAPPVPPKPPKKGRPERPGKGWSFENKEAEARYKAARKGVSAPTLIERVSESTREMWASMTTEFEGLPRTAEFARARFELHRVEKQNAVAQDNAIRVVEDMIKPMDDVDLEIFQRTILLRDLAREDAAGHDLPYGFKKGEPQAELDRLQPVLEERERAWSGIIRRQSIWDGIKRDYIKAMADIGFNVKDRLRNEDYFRHQVLLYANSGRELSKGGGGLRTPTGRGFLKKRGGSTLDINANYAQAEFEVMAQMMKDIEVAKAIRTIKDVYDISKNLKASAKAQTQAAMEALMEAEEPVAMIGLDAVGPTELQMRKYGQNIGYGFKLVHDAILERGIEPALATKWESVIASFEAQGTEADMDGPAAPEAVGPMDPNIFKFLAELASTDGPGAMGARVIFKSIAARKQFVQNTLGENYKEWRDIVPETHRLWQPREGNIFYFVDTVPAKLAQQIHNEVAESVGITKQDLARALSMGGPRAEYAIPVQLADALDAFNSPVPGSRFGEVLKTITTKWKQWQLISPRRVIKYNLRNISGDADVVFVGNPNTFKWVPDAIKELRPVFFSMKAPEGELREFFQRGGFETTLRAQEVSDLKDVEILSRLFDDSEKSMAEGGLNVFKKAWNKMALATDFRESILRYAAYRSFLNQLEAGELKSYGASVKEDVDALANNRDKAFKLSNDLLGAYDEVSVSGKWLREHLIPFWSFKEVNFRRYVQMFKNATMDGDSELGSRMARQMAATGVKQGARAGLFLVKATAAWVMLQLYNHMVWPDEEAELDAMTRNKAHLILWREADGRVAYFSGVGALGDILAWFGADAAPLMVKDYMSGKRTALEVAKEIGKAPFNIVAQGITPLIKMPAELAAQKQFYPDVFSPRPIRDNAQYLFRSVALGDEYNSLFKVPSRGYLDSMKNLLYYRMDPGQGSYLDISNMKRKFMQTNGIAHDGGHTTPKGEALYNYKLALRYDDKELAGRFLKQYITLGGKAAGVKQSLKNMGPLAGLSIRDRARFLKTLNQDDRIRLRNAEHYWQEILMGRRKD